MNYGKEKSKIMHLKSKYVIFQGCTSNTSRPNLPPLASEGECQELDWGREGWSFLCHSPLSPLAQRPACFPQEKNLALTGVESAPWSVSAMMKKWAQQDTQHVQSNCADPEGLPVCRECLRVWAKGCNLDSKQTVCWGYGKYSFPSKRTEHTEVTYLILNSLCLCICLPTMSRLERTLWNLKGSQHRKLFQKSRKSCP